MVVLYTCLSGCKSPGLVVGLLPETKKFKNWQTLKGPNFYRQDTLQLALTPGTGTPGTGTPGTATPGTGTPGTGTPGTGTPGTGSSLQDAI